jgi:hypothetical protein
MNLTSSAAARAESAALTGSLAIPDLSKHFSVPQPPVEEARAERAKILPFYDKVYASVVAIGGKPIALKYPLLIEVEPGSDCAISVFAPAISMGGVGDDITSAVLDLLSTVALVYQGLLDDEARLDRHARSTLRKLQSLLRG